METKPEKVIIYTTEELENISSFCSVLQRIRNRLISEGYSIEELKERLADKNIV